MVYNKYMRDIMGNSGKVINNAIRKENFYPEIYNNIYPLVVEKIRNLNLQLNNITKEELEKIANDIYFKIDNQNTNKSLNGRKYVQQIRNIALRDLIWIILVQEMDKFKNLNSINYYNYPKEDEKNKSLDFFESVKNKTYSSKANIYEN